MIDIDVLTVEANDINSLITGLEDVFDEKIYSEGSIKTEDFDFVLSLIRSIKVLTKKHAEYIEKKETEIIDELNNPYDFRIKKINDLLKKCSSIQILNFMTAILEQEIEEND